MTKTFILVLLISLFIFGFTGCVSATDRFAELIADQVNGGVLTPEQGEGLVDLWKSKAVADSDWWQIPTTILVTLVLNAFGIRSNLPIIGRGAPTQKVGLPASMIKATT